MSFASQQNYSNRALVLVLADKKNSYVVFTYWDNCKNYMILVINYMYY